MASFGLDGRMPPLRGDFLAVVTQNSSGNKIDWFLRRSTSSEVRYDPDSGATTSEVTVTLKNLAPRSGEPDVVIGGLGPDASRRGENRVYLSVYSPLALTHATAAGATLAMKREQEVGRNVYSAFLTVPAGGELVVRVGLRGEIHSGAGYRLDLRHQALREAEPFVVGVTIANGARQIRMGSLAEDAGLAFGG
jgi:hypothetical protein